MPPDLFEDGLGRRAAGIKNAGGADVVGKVLGITESVGEEEPSDREAPILRTDAEHALAVGPGADPHVVLQVHHTLRLSSRSARIQHERRGVAVRRRVGAVGIGGRRVLRRFVGRPGQATGACDRILIMDRCIEDEQSWITVAEDGPEVFRRQLSIQRHGDRAGRDRAPEDNRKGRAVRQQERHAVSVLDSLIAESGREAPHVPIEGAVGRLARVGEDGHPSVPTLLGMPLDEPGSGIEALRKVVARAQHGQACSPGPGLPRSGPVQDLADFSQELVGGKGLAENGLDRARKHLVLE